MSYNVKLKEFEEYMNKLMKANQDKNICIGIVQLNLSYWKYKMSKEDE